MIISSLGGFIAPQKTNEQNVASTVTDVDRQVNIAKNQRKRDVLLSLAENPQLDDKAVQELYNRDISQITKKLDGLGYENKNLLQRLF